MKPAAAAVSVLALLLVLRIPLAQEVYDLQRSYRPGQVDSYSVVLTVDSEDNHAIIALHTTDAVREVRRDGSYTVVSTIVDGTVDMNGTRFPFVGAGQSLALDVDRMGRTTLDPGSASRGDVGRLLGLSRMRFVPLVGLQQDHPLKFSLAMGGKSHRHASGMVTVLGTEAPGSGVPVPSVRVRTAAVLNGVPGDTGHGVHVDSVAYIDPRTHILYKQEGTISGIKLASLGDGKVTFTRVRLRDRAYGL